MEAVAFSAVQSVAATASMDGRLLVWDNSTLGIRSTCQHGEVRLAPEQDSSISGAQPARCSHYGCDR